METTHDISRMFHLETLPPATRKALNYLAEQSWLKKSDWYLAGGTALALQTGHRRSVDLDFFITQKDFSAQKLLSHFNDDIWKTDIVRDGTVYGRLYGAKISFIAYPFFVPKEEFVYLKKVRILSSYDIAVMKIIAVSQRGKKRDFFDLFWICNNIRSLKDILNCMEEQYPKVNHHYHHIVKSLTYFDDADNDPMPRIFFKASWKGIKLFFQQEVRKVAKELLGVG